MSGKVMTFLCHPDFDADALKAIVEPDKEFKNKAAVDCLILELMGIPTQDSLYAHNLREVIASARKSGCIVAVTTQDLVGSLDPSEVERLGESLPGAVYLHDMTSECAAIKAMYLFGKGLSAEAVRRVLTLNLRGELTTLSPRSSL
jgi:L-asparaginase